jgi:histidinol-phosphate/aromatic aminotransferase/cobyric acid decarboxylase-like protein/GNAT superfamily N-acetyltransferase
MNIEQLKLPQIPFAPATRRIRLAVADEADRKIIYQMRHAVYAHELSQHPINSSGELRDKLDASNVYITASVAGKIAGFVSITPPGPDGYSMDKYLARDQLPFAFDDRLHEIRLLTVDKAFRGRELALLLMYAALRWIEAHGGTRVIAIGRHEILDLYLRVGLQPAGMAVQSGAVTFDVLHGTMDELRQAASKYTEFFDHCEKHVDWRLNFSYRRPAPCFHGGAFFKAIGERFDTLKRNQDIIAADVLDAWFPPSPRVTAALEEHLPWLLRTSPPTAGEGLAQIIAETRGVEADSILAGAGSSALIFLALRQWLNRSSRVLILDPTYGEYGHVLEQVVRCRVDRMALSRAADYDVNLADLEERLALEYDCVVLVNPNSPTGRHITRPALEEVLRRAPRATKFWIDETYVDYTGPNQSLERFAARSENVVVCKSMSKVYALSGARAAYLCASPALLEELRSITPPWAVSLVAQVAAVRALQDPGYYAGRYAETALLRAELSKALAEMGMDVIDGAANFLLCHLPEAGASAVEIVARCRKQNLFLRDASPMGSGLGRHALRIAVKDRATNRQMLRILADAMGVKNDLPHSPRLVTTV